MANMFYSLQDITKKFNKTEDEIKELVSSGKLREFRDGSNLLFKVDEVDTLLKPAIEPDLEQLVLSDTGTPSAGKEPQKPADKGEESISLADETGSAGSKADLINADTALINESLNLGETSGKGENLEDILEATKAGAGKPAEKSGDELALDTFGSGGLLDVSIPAEDTSLGGILDEIYTSESAEATPAGKNAPPAEAVIKEEEMLEGPRQLVEPIAVAAPVEIKPDTFSNALGIALFIPILATILTIIIVARGLNLNKILGEEGMMGINMGWIVMAALIVLTLLVIGGGALIGSLSSAERKPKEKKVKPPKPPKLPKPPKVKKEKKK